MLLRNALFFMPLLWLAGIVSAAAEINLSPLRQVITAERPVVTYMLSNPSDRHVEAQIRWIDLAANKMGYREASSTMRTELSAAPYLFVQPNHVSLAPGERTKITVALRADAPQLNGERRSHLLIMSKAVRTPLRRASNGLQPDLGMGISTPVILRAPGGLVQVGFSKGALIRQDNGDLALEADLHSEGDRSAFGRIEAQFSPANGDDPYILGRLSNIASYVETPLRTVVVPLGTKALPAGRLTLRYLGTNEYDGAELAEKSFDIKAPE